MWVKYLNLEYWFYQIYLLMQTVFGYIETPPLLVMGPVVKIISFVLSILFLIMLIHSWHKTKLIRAKEQEELLAGFIVAVKEEQEKSQEWQDILNHLSSDNESQWKLALIEADKILENLLRDAGFDGEGIGERLKRAEAVGGLKTLQDAWEAHKIRNKIAHESGFVLTKREAIIAVESYKKVFKELKFL